VYQEHQVLVAQVAQVVLMVALVQAELVALMELVVLLVHLAQVELMELQEALVQVQPYQLQMVQPL
jgi:hypothetical protein